MEYAACRSRVTRGGCSLSDSGPPEQVFADPQKKRTRGYLARVRGHAGLAAQQP